MSEQQELERFLDFIVKYIPLAVAILIVTSVIREYGYFAIIGVDLLTLLSAGDFLRSTILWLPSVAILLLIGSYIGIRAAAKAHGVRQAAELEPTIQKVRKVVVADIAVWLGFFGSLIFSFAVMYFYNFVQALPLLVGLIYFGWSRSGYGVSALKLNMGVIVIFLTIVFMWGATNALRDLKKVDTVKVRNSVPDTERLVVLLRFLDRGALVRAPGGGEIEFIPWDDLKSATYSHQRGFFERRLFK